MDFSRNPQDRERRFERLRMLLAEMKVSLVEWVKFATLSQLITLSHDLLDISSIVSKQHGQLSGAQPVETESSSPPSTTVARQDTLDERS